MEITPQAYLLHRKSRPSHDRTNESSTFDYHILMTISPSPLSLFTQTNVGKTERYLSGLAGAALTLYGLRRGGLLGGLFALAGAGLVRRGASGNCPYYSSRNISTTPDGVLSPLEL